MKLNHYRFFLLGNIVALLLLNYLGIKNFIFFITSCAVFFGFMCAWIDESSKHKG